jgi:hypothetical protein
MEHKKDYLTEWFVRTYEKTTTYIAYTFLYGIILTIAYLIVNH